MISATLIAGTLSRLRGEELSDISHALRSPLTSIVGFADAILSDPGLEGSQKEEFVRIIKAESERLSKFVDELLYASVLGREPNFKDHWDLATVVNSSFHSVSVSAAERSITLQHSLPATLPRLFLEKELVTKMLDNVLANAIRYAPDRSEISVSAELAGADMVICVQAKRVKSSVSDDAGLARTRHLLRIYGGSLQFTETASDESTITLRIPLGN